MATQAEQDTHAAGRISQGIAPAIARQSAGQTGMQSPQPGQSDSLRTGNSRTVVLRCGADGPADRRLHKSRHQVLDHRLLQGRE